MCVQVACRSNTFEISHVLPGWRGLPQDIERYFDPDMGMRAIRKQRDEVQLQVDNNFSISGRKEHMAHVADESTPTAGESVSSRTGASCDQCISLVYSFIRKIATSSVCVSPDRIPQASNDARVIRLSQRVRSFWGSLPFSREAGGGGTTGFGFEACNTRCEWKKSRGRNRPLIFRKRLQKPRWVNDQECQCSSLSLLDEVGYVCMPSGNVHHVAIVGLRIPINPIWDLHLFPTHVENWQTYSENRIKLVHIYRKSSS